MPVIAAPVTAGLPPVAGRGVRVLILGSLPSVRSLQKQEYYAHPRNAFWTIIGEIAGFDPGLDYGERCTRLGEAGIALWDVLAAAVRPGSLDCAIERSKAQCNDFQTFFRQHGKLRLVACNGAKAGLLFQRQVLPGLTGGSRVDCITLPSTSPANAAMTLAEKRSRWSIVAEYLPKCHDETS